MSVKTYCNGCNDQLTEHQIVMIAEAQHHIVPAHSGGETTFHWCSDCTTAIMKFSQTRRRNESGT